MQTIQIVLFTCVDPYTSHGQWHTHWLTQFTTLPTIPRWAETHPIKTAAIVLTAKVAWAVNKDTWKESLQHKNAYKDYTN